MNHITKRHMPFYMARASWEMACSSIFCFKYYKKIKSCILSLKKAEYFKSQLIQIFYTSAMHHQVYYKMFDTRDKLVEPVQHILSLLFCTEQVFQAQDKLFLLPNSSTTLDTFIDLISLPVSTTKVECVFNEPCL